MTAKTRVISATLSASVIATALCACASVGALMSPYSEKFDCKNSDHGQCIHPERAFEDAVAGTPSKSDPAVINNKRMLRSTRLGVKGRSRSKSLAYGRYRDSVYQELKGLIDAPVTPMLRPAQTVRTLILPYADRQRPDRLYMPRYIYSVLDNPVWVVGAALVSSPPRVSRLPVLSQVKTASENDIGHANTLPVAEPLP